MGRRCRNVMEDGNGAEHPAVPQGNDRRRPAGPLAMGRSQLMKRSEFPERIGLHVHDDHLCLQVRGLREWSRLTTHRQGTDTVVEAHWQVWSRNGLQPSAAAVDQVDAATTLRGYLLLDKVTQRAEDFRKGTTQSHHLEEMLFAQLPDFASVALMRRSIRADA